MILSKLTPAETLLVRDGNLAPLKDLLKYTFMDLLLKQVLLTQEIQRQPNKRDPVKTYKYVGPGMNFHSYSSQAHELVFLSPFYKNSAIRIMFRNLVKIGYENSHNEKSYHQKVMRTTELRYAFSKPFMLRFFGYGSPQYTSIGRELKTKVDQEIAILEQQIANDFLKNREKALDLLRSISGNVFLLNGLQFSIAKEIDEELMKELSKRGETGCGNYGCSGCWPSFDSYNDHFGSACSAASDSGGGDGGGGCSGDGGCSGCGGGD